MLLHDITSVKKSHYNCIREVIFVMYCKERNKMCNEYLCHLTFTFSKFTLKNFIFFIMMYDVIKYFPKKY